MKRILVQKFTRRVGFVVTRPKLTGVTPELPDLFFAKGKGVGVPPERWTRSMLGFPPSEENQDEEG